MEIEKENVHGDEATGKKVIDIICERIGSYGRRHVIFILFVIVPVKVSACSVSLGTLFLAPRTTCRCVQSSNTTTNSKALLFRNGI